MKYKVKMRMQNLYPVEVEFEVADPEELKQIEQVWADGGFSSVLSQSALADPRKNSPVGDAPLCSMHKAPMNKLTRTGKPYHSFEGNNCSGDGWWPKQPK